LVVKVPRLATNGWMLKTEYDHLVALWDCIGTDAANYVPKPYALTSLQAIPVLVISHVPGESLTRLSRKAFWGDSRKVMGLAKEAGRTLRELNRLTESPIDREEVLHTDFQTRADKFRELFKLNAEEDRALSELVQAVNERSKVASHKILAQGDFWHGNMIRNRKRGTLMFVDWQFARWSVDVSLDLYFFLLAGALSATGKGAAKERARTAYQLLSDWRSDVIPQYLAAYGSPEHYTLLPQKQGMLLCCVEKSIRSTHEFGYNHSDDLLWRYLFAELQNWPVEDD
ncbi:MAG TPA: phosphotransferase, partial [Anaerolineales bacterium]|nr:phosphotransferase [Anaerolineales bacterium]